MSGIDVNVLVGNTQIVWYMMRSAFCIMREQPETGDERDEPLSDFFWYFG
jgi:hypothetical protein